MYWTMYDDRASSSRSTKLSVRLALVTSLLILPCLVQSLHVKGTWQTSENFFHFLAKFGFQRTNQHDRSNTQGYIYGNITSRSSNHSSVDPLTLVVVDRSYFLEYYGNRTRVGGGSGDRTCEAMFHKIDTIAYDSRCHERNIEDFLRRVPCPRDGLCVDEDKPNLVVPGYQFTYGVQDINQPRFWYVSMVACSRTDPLANCTWMSTDADLTIDYDIWLVNGNPYTSMHNPFEYQFSFEKQDIVEIYLVFVVLYVGLVCVQTYGSTRQRHLVTYLLTFTIGLGLLSNVLQLAHLLKFSYDGEGMEGAGVAGDICNIFSQTGFVLVLLLLGKGWAVTNRQPSWKFVLLGLWSIYLGTNLLLYVWNGVAVDIASDVDEYQTWPGWMALVLRMVIMMWFLWELRRTMQRERSKTKLQFLLHFGASSLVWFIYLPTVALVAINVSALWRFKLLLGITSSVNFLAFASTTHLLWPLRHESYAHLGSGSSATTESTDELEEFNEAPHVLNQKNYLMRHPHAFS